MQIWLDGLLVAVQGINLLYLLLGTAVGLVVGALPGLGPMFGVALMLPFIYGIPPATAIIFLAAVHASTAYGDSIASILINTPGGVGSIASCWDGYPLARQGKAGMALGISTVGSFLGGVIGWISLVLIAPLLTALALRIGPAEYFMLGLMALSLLAVAAKGQTVRGLVMAGLGITLAFIGRDPIQGVSRLTFGSLYLEDGLPLIPVTVGMFALSQAMVLAEEGGSIGEIQSMAGGIWQGLKESVKRPLTVARGGVIGILLGIMPALGLSTASIVAYLMEKRASKEPETFGKGNPAGLLAPETAKSACVVGDLIPTFTLGIPGSATTAILMAALTIKGIQPGPQFFLSGSMPYAIFMGILLAQLSFFLSGIALTRYFARMVAIPNSILVPAIVALTFYGTYAVHNNLLDVLLTLVFGLIGYLFIKTGYPSACLVLGLVLGELIETQFHRAILIGNGSASIFFTRRLSLLFLVITVLFLFWPYLESGFRRLLGAPRPLAADSEKGD